MILTKLTIIRRVVISSALLLMVYMPSAKAELVNQIASCYAAYHLPYRSAAPDKLLYVLIDQTVQLSPILQKTVIGNINGLLLPGTKFVIDEFSAFSQERYLRVAYTGIIETQLTGSQKGNIPLSELPRFNTCLRDQRLYANRMADQVVIKIMKNSTYSLAHSDIMATLKIISSAIASDGAKRKILFLISDGLENSSIMSFYGRGTVRNINPRTEFQKAKAAHLLGNFGGAKVYVLGGADMPPASYGTSAMREGYRDPRMLYDLKTFWKEYFKASSATLIEFGEPDLVEPVSY